MDSKEFRQRGREMVDYIAEYMETVGERRVTPGVEPGYLRDLIPKEAPKKGEKWEEIMTDVEDKIMPGVITLVFSFLNQLHPTHVLRVQTIIPSGDDSLHVSANGMIGRS